MKRLAKLRRWLNRDNGKLYRVGNRPVGILEAVGLIVVIAAIALWQVHVKAGISSVWALVAGAVGLALAILGNAGDNDGPEM
jgi:hypothetical protein